MPDHAIDLLLLLAAIPAAAFGGAAFLKGVIGVATWLRLPRMLVATTLAAFATSSPELAVSSLAALSGRPGIGLGDALGSNVVNLGLILGVALLFRPLAVHLSEIRRDLTMALLVPLLILWLAHDGRLSQADGALLLIVFAGWMAALLRHALTQRQPVDTTAAAPVNALVAWLQLGVGLMALVLAGRLFVTGASGIAVALGVHPYVIGATLVAIGTSLPEFVTVVLARLRGHDDVSLGTLIGNNLFNGLAVIGIAASIQPIQAPSAELGVALAFGLLTVLLILPRAGQLPRHRGLWLLAAYTAFVLATAGHAR